MLPIHVLEYHDRVVDDQTEAHSHTHQGQYVERQSTKINEVQRDEDGECDRGKYDRRRPERLQEQQKYGKNDDRGDDRALAQISQLGTNFIALIIVEDQPSSRRME